MLNILAISENGEGYGLATRLAKEKNFVRFYSENYTGEGFKLPKKVSTISKEDEEDLILCLQNTSYTQEGVKGMVDMGRVVIGSGGILTKLSDTGFQEKVKSLIRKNGDEEGDFREVYRFYGTNGYLPFYIENKVNKRVCEGEKGAWCISTGNYIKVKDSFPYSYIFEDIEGLLSKVGFIGLIGFEMTGSKVNRVISELNVGMIHAFLELCHFSFTELLMSLLYELPFSGKFRQGVGLSVMVSIPPYPFSCYSNIALDEVLVYKDEFVKHFFLDDVMKTPEGLSTGSHGLLGWSTAYGTNLREAKRRVYRTINNIVKSPALQYRKDIGED